MVAKILSPILDGIHREGPIRRLGRPDEVARVVVPPRERSRHHHGAMYAVNGGLIM